MATYEYLAKTSDGQEVSGVMEADNESAIARALDEKSLFPIRIAEQAQGRRPGGRKVHSRDVGVFYGQLADLLRAGVPIMRALETLQRANSRGPLSQIILKVRDDISAGKTLADAMASHPATFTSLHSAMIKAGEQAGCLEDVLTNMAEFLERQDDLRSKVRGALIYPILLMGIGTVVLVVILLVLVPRFKPFFDGMDLPTPTVILFALSDLLKNQIWLVMGVLLLLVIGIRAILGSRAGRRSWERWRNRIPLAGRAIRMVSITRFCRILGTMLANGVPLLHALAISKDAAGSVQLSDSIAQAAENVRAGQALATPLRDSRMFPEEIVEMIAVAEESNQLEKVLVQIANTVERRTNRQVDQAVRLIEPIILVLMAALIGFVVIGLMYPIFTMSSAIGR